MMYRTLRSALYFAAAVVAVAGGAQAATTGSVNLSGSIGQSCNLTVSASGNTGLNLANTATATSVTTVTEACNDKLGYNVTLVTTNGTTTGLFKGPSGNTDTLAYTVTYNGAAKTFAASSSQITTAAARTAPGGVAKTLAISYTGNSALNADTYTDTLTLTMTAN